MDLSHGDHDVRFFDGSVKEAYEIVGQVPRPSVRMTFERGVAYYCPSCGAASASSYSAQPAGALGDRDAALLDSRTGFLAIPASCESTRRLIAVEDVMLT